MIQSISKGAKKKIKIGIAGMRRGLNLGRLFAAREDCEVVVACDLNHQRAEETAAELGAKALTDYDQLCEQDMDVIVIATPVQTHYECTVKALEAGKHVLCEIPAVEKLDEAESLLKKVKETGLKYMAAENVCYFPCIQLMNKMVSEGKIGEVAFAEGEYVHSMTGSSLLFNRDDGLGGGTDKKPSWRANFDAIRYSTHELGPLLMILDDRVVTVVGMEGVVKAASFEELTKVQTALFKTAKGRVIREVTAFYVKREPDFHFYGLYGTKGSI